MSLICFIILLSVFNNLLIYAERSFEITDYQAQVKILENGDIQVSEIFEYDFDGDFNGIIRTIGIKGSDGFKYFKASEYLPIDKELNYDQSINGDMVTYKIYDKSSNERKLFLLEYQLKNVTTLYNDTAEFYWKFFDKSNTSPIGHIKIEVELPGKEVLTEELKVFGHGPLNGTISIQEDRKILYEVNNLSSGEMVEARILFPTRLIPSSYKVINENKSAAIMKEELEWAKQNEQGNLKKKEKEESEIKTSNKVETANLTLIVITSLTSVFSNATHDLVVTIDGPTYDSKTIKDVGTASPVPVHFVNIPQGHYKVTAKYGSKTISKEINVSGDTLDLEMTII